jgi:chaperone modulatory protein CbpM
MTPEHIAELLEDALLELEEVAVSCTVSREWIVERVHTGVLLLEAGADPSGWRFSGRDLLRTRRLFALERDFDANPELAGLVADLMEEIERLRTRLRRAGLSLE